MSDNGWIKLHRQATESAVFSDAWAWQLFCWCLLKANHKPLPWRGRVIPRGSFATGRLSAAEQLGVSESKFRRGLEKLKLFGVITTQATNKYTVVRVEKYESFQKRDDETDQQAANNRPSSDQQPTTNKNEKKVKKFVPPTLDQVSEYVQQYAQKRRAEGKPWEAINPEKFVNHYTANGCLLYTSPSPRDS